MSEKPVWVKTNKIEKPGLYLYGGCKEKPSEEISAVFYAKKPRIFSDYHWLAYLGPIPEPEMPRPDLKIDDPVIVWDFAENAARRRHFAGWTDDGKVKTWNQGTSWLSCYTTIWNYYRLPTEDELKTPPKP